MMAKLFWMRFFFWVDKKEDMGSSSVFYPSLIEGVRVEPFTDLSQASTAMTPLEGLHLSLQQGGFQGTQFKGEVSIEAREKLLLTPALRQDGFEKVSVTRDSKILQKTQAHQGQGVDYLDCSVQGHLAVDTPHLEVVSKTGQRPSGMEIVPRPEFTEIHRTVVPSITEESQRPRTTFKPAFKAALGVGVAALAGASGEIASGVLAASAQAFIQKGGLESLANHESLQLSDMLKAAGKSLAVQGLSLGIGDLGIAGNLVKTTAAHSAIYGGNPLETLARQGVFQISAAGASEIGQAYRSGLSGLEHKLLHGALAMASTVSLQALESGTGDWNQALLAAGATMAAESMAEGCTGIIREQLPTRELGEEEEGYFQRCDEAIRGLAETTSASLRVLTAASLTLAGQDAAVIQACDFASANALENNFVQWIVPAVMALLTGLEVWDGALEISEDLQEGKNSEALETLVKTGIKVLPGMKLAKAVVQAGETAGALKNAYKKEGMAGAGAVLAQEILGRQVGKALGKGLEKVGDFKRTTKALTGPKPVHRLPQGAGGEGGLLNKPVSAEEQAAITQYFTHYRNAKFVVGQHGDIEKIMENRNIEFKSVMEDFTARHHTGTHANNRRFIAFNIHPDAGVSIIIPEIWHQKGNLHTANHLKFDNLRQSLFWTIRDLRNCTNRIADPVLRKEVQHDLNAALIQAVRLNEQHFAEQMHQRILKP
ncbi:hypothetical protein [Holospora curviuscula]|nr:hypothetical protein [Holospora curviuscula]